MSTTELLQREWAAFRRPGRLIALATAALTVIALGLVSSLGNRSSCNGPCPSDPVAGDGSTVSDTFWFLHRDLGPEGSITVRMTSMTGTITYPPPDHDEIVSGLVPWAKAGIIVKDGLRQGSPYAALMMTGSHGVRFQYDYKHDVAGGGPSGRFPRWLRLTRSGDTITGAESADGRRWRTVATARLAGLPDTVQVGLALRHLPRRPHPPQGRPRRRDRGGPVHPGRRHLRQRRRRGRCHRLVEQRPGWPDERDRVGERPPRVRSGAGRRSHHGQRHRRHRATR
ncbi:hypothetical protein ABZV93_13445 [Actinopolymorpha sp. NPDC004070]|uniref:hypothetical protein n=1 Tax=Actinopolymorpha sp. NPDC004070 TaxID=3154548 RepID=UPI0033B7E4B4